MTAMQGALSAAERSMRSVFVGNIPYEATEEQLKDIFAEVGPVVSFRLVYDRETGKPKGYGFCEYKDQEMALSAMRNLNGYELNGRALRVDNAASEKSKEELKNLQASLGGPPVESPFGAEVSADEAPDVIARVMSSLPPEQLHELMVQMKQCIENNPNEARVLLLQNPQLCYALLQAQVIMKIVDPIQAKAMLHSQNPFTMSAAALLPTPEINANQVPTSLPGLNEVTPTTFPPSAMTQGNSGSVVLNSVAPQRPLAPLQRPSLLGDRPPAQPNSVVSAQYPETGINQRPLGDHDLRQMPVVDRDMRAPPLLGGDKDMRHQAVDEDFRGIGGPGRMPDTRPLDSRYQNSSSVGQSIPPGMNSGDMRNMPPSDLRNMRSLGDMRNMAPGDMRNVSTNEMHHLSQQPQGRNMPPVDSRNIPPIRSALPNPSNPAVRPSPMQSVDARGMPVPDTINRGPIFDRPPSGANFDMNRPPIPPQMNDHRNLSNPINSPNIGPRPPQNPRIAAVGGSSPAIGGASPSAAPSPRSNSALAAAAAALAPHDQEKAALIMQVLQLSDQQIAMLPPEQRQSILILKDQIARSTQSS